MEEVQENSEVAQVAPDQQTENHESAPEQQPTQQAEDPQERNWRAVRARQKELEHELKTQRELNEKLMTLATQQVQKPKEVDEFDSIADDEFIPKGKVKSLVSKEASRIAEEIAERKAREMYQKQEQANFLENLKRKYTDFTQVVNPENLALLEEQEPELAQTIADLKDPYKMGVQSYKFIKALKISEKAPEARRSKEVDKKLEKNAKTVQSPHAYESRPMAQAFKLTDTEKTELYKEMMGYASQAGFSY